MNIKDTALLSARGGPGKKHVPDYRQKLARQDGHHERPAQAAHANPEPVEQVRRLAEEPQVDTLAFQSVLVAALKTLHRVLWSERQAAEAAISLGQREKLHFMVQAVETTIHALSQLLTPQGEKMLGMSPTYAASWAHEDSWWYALNEAHRVNSESADWMRSVVAGQPKDGPARKLSNIVTSLLQEHDHVFQGEAEKLSG